MFWGLILEPGKRYSTIVDKSFHVSMAALDCSSVKKDNEILKVIVEIENQENLLCNLSKEKGILQERLDLLFMTGDDITFECKGSGIVHLSGYFVVEDMCEDDLEGEPDEERDEECEEESEESDTDLSTIAVSNLNINRKLKAEKRKRKVPPPQQNKKKKTLDDEIASDGDSVVVFDDEEIGSEYEESDLLSEEDEDAESDDDETDEEKKEGKPVSPQQQKKLQNKQQSPEKLNKSNIANGVTPIQKQSGKNKKMNSLNPQSPKAKRRSGQSADQNALTPKAKTQSEQSPVQNTVTPKVKTPSEDVSPKKRLLESGIVIKDMIVGNGPAAKMGKFVEVYYTGKLKGTHQVVDSVNVGDGFKFRLGKGEVIKGFDIGINGMKVGGKRLITCPPKTAYGLKGLPPTIPPNSTIIFEVELRG